MNQRPTALVADDEPLLRDTMVRMLAAVWPELVVVALARNGREAIAMYDVHQPDVCFLDVHMPGLSGMDAAHAIGRRAHVVFVTAFDQYAVRAFTEGALDYLVKPVEGARLADTVDRLIGLLQYLLPLAVLELYVAAQASQRPAVKRAVAVLLFALTAAMALGIGVATMGLWWPNI